MNGWVKKYTIIRICRSANPATKNCFNKKTNARFDCFRKNLILMGTAIHKNYLLSVTIYEIRAISKLSDRAFE